MGLIRPQSGSLTSLVWTPDGTQLAAAGGNGSVVFGQVIERSIEWDNFEVLWILAQTKCRLKVRSTLRCVSVKRRVFS